MTDRTFNSASVLAIEEQLKHEGKYSEKGRFTCGGRLGAHYLSRNRGSGWDKHLLGLTGEVSCDWL